MGNIGLTEVLIVLVIVVVLFGAKRLPELARSGGRSLRIFRAETKGLLDGGEGETPEGGGVVNGVRASVVAPSVGVSSVTGSGTVAGPQR